MPTRGRPNIFQRIWNLLITPLRKRFRGRQNSQQSFTQRSDRPMSIQERNYDLEVSEMPVRSTLKARELIEIRENCPEAGVAVAIISDDCFSSVDGDDYGVVVSEDDVNGDRLDSQVYAVAATCLRRVLPLSTLKKVIDRMVSYGDCFGELAINTRGERQISALQLLPTWEMFRIEDRGVLERFEQRRYLHDENSVVFAPAEVVHWRYQHDFLYGRSQWHQSVPDWVNLKKSIYNYIQAGNDVGVNPTVHIAPPGKDDAWMKNYRSIHQDTLKDGIETHMYMANGGDIRKLANNNPNLSALREQVELFTRRFVGRSRIEAWKLNIFEVGAKDLSNQPSLAYSRFINGLRGDLSEGIKQILHTELILKGVPPERWQGLIKLSYPKIHVDIYNGQEVELAESDEHPDSEAKNRLSVVGGDRRYA